MKKKRRRKIQVQIRQRIEHYKDHANTMKSLASSPGLARFRDEYETSRQQAERRLQTVLKVARKRAKRDDVLMIRILKRTGNF